MIKLAKVKDLTDGSVENKQAGRVDSKTKAKKVRGWSVYQRKCFSGLNQTKAHRNGNT